MKLTKLELEVMIILFLYRGLRALDVAVFRINSTNITRSNEKSAYNILKRLIEKGVVAKLKNAAFEHSIYSLNSKGLEWIKHKLDIPFAANGNGYLPVKSDTTYWDIPYKIYSPPRYQWGHYLMTIDFIKNLISFGGEIRYQLAYYCNLHYEYNNKKYKVKPDLVVYTRQKNYAIEIDTGTESVHQLIAKFNKYKLYCDYCSDGKGMKKKIDTILFVVPNASENNLDRRWITILAAFYTAFEESLNTPINLIFTSLDEVESTIHLELEKQFIGDDCKGYLGNKLLQQGYTSNHMYQAMLEVNPTQLYLNENNKTYKSLWVMVNHKRESEFYHDKYSFKVTQEYLMAEPFPSDKHNGYKYLQDSSLFISLTGKPIKLTGLNKTGLSKTLINELESLPELYDRYQPIDLHKVKGWRVLRGSNQR